MRSTVFDSFDVVIVVGVLCAARVLSLFALKMNGNSKWKKPKINQSLQII